MWRRASGKMHQPSSRHPTAQSGALTCTHPSRCLSGAQTARAAHWPSAPSSRRAPGECRVARAHEEDRL
eukprot:7360307-Prymnesium_polylepis.1